MTKEVSQAQRVLLLLVGAERHILDGRDSQTNHKKRGSDHQLAETASAVTTQVNGLTGVLLQ